MYIPIFLAILMGLISPTNQSTNPTNKIVYAKIDGPIVQNSTSETDSIPPGDGGDTGGETGNNPPRP